MSFSSNRSSSRIINKNLKSMVFLQTMTEIIPRAELVDMIESKLPNKREELGGRPRIDTKKKLKMYFLSMWFNLSDIQTEELIYDRHSFQYFMDIDVTADQIPDSTTFDFRKFINGNSLGEDFLSIVNKSLNQRGVGFHEGTLIDSTIIKAPSSTKNSKNERDPEMTSTKKSNNFHFGAKIHIATDTQGLITDLQVTTASVHDSQMYDSLTDENTISTVADSAYTGKPIQEIAQQKGITHTAMIKRKRNQKELLIEARLWNTILAMPRKIVEFPFGVIKNIRGHRKTKYKGLAKLQTQRHILSGLCNLFRVRKKLLHIS